MARRLNDQFGTAFVGRPPDEIDARLSVSRTRQRRAIAAHRSQSPHNPVLSRRLALLRDREHLRSSTGRRKETHRCRTRAALSRLEG